MKRLALSAAALLVAAGLKSASVGAQLRWQTLERSGKRRAWRLHLALIAPPWLLFLASPPGI